MEHSRPTRIDRRQRATGPRRTRRRWTAVVLLAGVATLSAFGHSAADARPPLSRQPDPFEATTSATARQNAVQSIPFEKLDPQARAKVHDVLSNISVFRRLPVRVIDCDPHLYLFMVRHPDVVVNIWETLELSTVQLRRTGPNSFQIIEDEGSVARFEFLYQSYDTHIVYVEGTYTGPLLRRSVKGRCLLVLKSGYVLETDGRYYITNRLDAFVNVDPGGLELLTKTIQPVLGRVADHNFTQTVAFAGSLSHTAEVNGAGVQRLASQLLRVAPDQRRQLAELAGGVGQRTAARTAPVPRPPAMTARQE